MTSPESRVLQWTDQAELLPVLRQVSGEGPREIDSLFEKLRGDRRLNFEFGRLLSHREIPSRNVQSIDKTAT
ncbi:hypothetical protein ACFPRL_16285 [Pseudoclavibacter helvolus]